MRSKGHQKIAIVGGGPAGLAAAFELTKTGRCPGDCVTVYQTGWRLGGKCASGRDNRRRIVEHGLHLWFGYYENAFRLLREAYAELPNAPRRFRHWNDAFQPLACTQIGDQRLAKDGSFIPFTWPRRAGSPGDGREPHLWESVIGLFKLLSQLHDAFVEGASPRPRTIAVHPHYARAFDSLFKTRGSLEDLSPRDAVRRALRWSVEIGTGISDPIHLFGVKALVRAAAKTLWEECGGGAHPMVSKDKLLTDVTDIAAAFVSGLIDDVIINRMEIVELDEFDFRDWLSANGADDRSVNESPLVRALYDTMFQYCEGDTARPSYGAGTAAQVVLRLLGTYKGDAVWKASAGLGEVLIAPLYQVLKTRGVRFAFFHKLKRIELTEDRTGIARLHFSRQVDLPDDRFEPTFAFKDITCWPAAPPADLVKAEDGAPSSDLESRWCTTSAKPDLILAQGMDFAEVVLAIPLGAFKSLRRDPGPCEELIRANPRFRQMSESIGMVPSLSVQVWSPNSLAELGWPKETAAMVSGPQALQIWTDMSQVLAYEDWNADGPKSVHYFCNVFGSPAFRDPAAVGPANEAARSLVTEWFEKKAGDFWPNATQAASGRHTTFRWTSMEDPLNRVGRYRLEAQVVKANVDPSACCCGSAAGSTAWRLKTDGSGFHHLFLAGAWIDTGFNTECVEAAIMSGKQASRAICGSPAIIEGENFMRPRKSAGMNPFNIARDVLTALAFVR
jgi:uncharacterized protein with NAD-binding domain and iron-sulfur cluster